ALIYTLSLHDALPISSSDKTHLTGDDYVVTWTVGHLVGLADPEVYDPKLKKWRYADLPIVPSKFKLTPNDAKAEKQLKAIHRLRSEEHTSELQSLAYL